MGKKSKVHYIGLIVEQDSQHCDDLDTVANTVIGLQRADWNVQFLRRESQSAFTVVFPQVDDVSTVNEKSFCEKLPIPTGSVTARKRSHLMFPIDLSEYNLRLTELLGIGLELMSSRFSFMKVFVHLKFKRSSI